MNPFAVARLLELQERAKEDSLYVQLWEDYSKYSAQVVGLLHTLPDEEWEALTRFLGACFSINLRLLELILTQPE